MSEKTLGEQAEQARREAEATERERLHRIIQGCYGYLDIEAHPELAAEIEAVLAPCDEAGHCVAPEESDEHVGDTRVDLAVPVGGGSMNESAEQRLGAVEALFCEAHQPPHDSCPCCEAVRADDRRLDAEAALLEAHALLCVQKKWEPKPIDYEQLDPGIRDLVRRLREAGFDTTDSGDGVSKPPEWYQPDERGITEAFDFPHVVCKTEPHLLFAESRRLLALLGDEWDVEANYHPRHGSATMLARPSDERIANGVVICHQEEIRTCSPSKRGADELEAALQPPTQEMKDELSLGTAAVADRDLPPSTPDYLHGLYDAQRAVVEACTACDGQGFVIGVETENGHDCDGTEASCAVRCPVPIPVQVQEPCEYCGRPSDAIRALACSLDEASGSANNSATNNQSNEKEPSGEAAIPPQEPQ